MNDSLPIGRKQMQSEQGFTLIELLLAMAILGFFLLIISVGVLGVVKTYRTSISNRLTQNAARVAMDEITRNARFANKVEVKGLGGGGGAPYNLCFFGSTNFRYYVTAERLKAETFTGGTCETPTGMVSEKFLTPDSLVVDAAQGFQVEQVDPLELRSATVKLRVKTETAGTSEECFGGDGAEFCSTTLLEFAVSARGGL